MSQQLELLTDNPLQWTTIVNITPEIQKKEIKPFLILALKELQGNPDSRTSSLVNCDKFAAVRAVLRHLARLRSAAGRWGAEDVSTFLEGLKFNPECVSELCTLLCTDTMYDGVPTHLRVKPALISLQWKIDLSLSQSKLQGEQADKQTSKEIIQRDTHIILSLSLSSGEKRTYRLSISKFHELRFAIASALKYMIVLEKRKCMRKD